MAKESKRKSEIVERVMHEFKHGELESGGGEKVKSRRQAVAIALSEAGESNRVSPAQNRKRRRKTEANERQGKTGRARTEGGPTKSELYERAKKEKVSGRSTMSKAELAKALGR